ncbi:hypothetical protein ACJMK2_032600 [Sinanodonta woodiana]|uniref:DUF7042 domain-containing protein n=1 Tax=Sinanodonta woodiana TaxID=1069815 RepID=A0ABD3X271_SINWO
MPDKHILRCIIIFWTLFKIAEGACTFPSEFQNTEWYDSNKGTITFNTSVLSGWSFTAFGTTVSTWNCLSTSYYSSGYLLMSGINTLKVSGQTYYSYLCLKLTKITEYSYTYLRVNAEQTTASNERVYVSNTSSVTSFSSICDVGNIEPSSQFHVLIKSGSNVNDTKQTCPTSVLGNFDYVYNDSTTKTLSCNSSTDQWVVCNDRQTMTFNYSTCSQTMAYSKGGFVWCVHSVVGTYTYLMVFNNDSTSIIDSNKYYRFTCFVVSDSSTSASMVYGSCKKGQTPYTYAQDSVSGSNIGALLTLKSYVTCPILSSSTSSDNKIGAIVGGVIGAMVTIALVVIILIFLYKKKRLCFGNPAYTVVEKKGSKSADTEDKMELITGKKENELKPEKKEKVVKPEHNEEVRAEKHQTQRVEKAESVSHGEKLLTVLEKDNDILLPSDREKVHTILNIDNKKEEEQPKMETNGDVVFKAPQPKAKQKSKKKKKKKPKLAISRMRNSLGKVSNKEIESEDMDFQDIEEISYIGSDDLEGSDEELKALQRESTIESITYKSPNIEKVSKGNKNDKSGTNSKMSFSREENQQINNIKASTKASNRKKAKLKRPGSVSSKASMFSLNKIQKAGKGKKKGLKVAWAKDLESTVIDNDVENVETSEDEVMEHDNADAHNVTNDDPQEIENVDSVSEHMALSRKKRKRGPRSGSVAPSTEKLATGNKLSKKKKKSKSKSKYIKTSKLKGKGSGNATPAGIDSFEDSKMFEHRSRVTFEDEKVFIPSEPITQIEKENSKLSVNFLELLLNDEDFEENKYSAGLSLAERESKMIDEGYITPSLVEREVTLSRAPTSTSMKGSPALSLGERRPTVIRLSSAKARGTETVTPVDHVNTTLAKPERVVVTSNETKA